jgi:hypothetical protein
MYSIVSSIPGRMRIRDASLRAEGNLARLAQALMALDASRAVTTNPRCGSALFVYDGHRAARADMEAAAARLLEEIVAPDGTPPEPTPELPPEQDRHARAPLKKLNRYAKHGMAASLALSLWLAYFSGGRRRHALAGWVFIACLGVHLARHRHRLWS